MALLRSDRLNQPRVFQRSNKIDTRVIPTNHTVPNEASLTRAIYDSFPFIQRRPISRFLSEDKFIEFHGSGTLNKNKRVGFKWRGQYMHERVAFEFGYHWEILASTRITFGEPITEADNKSVTETGWYVDRYLNHLVFDEDKFYLSYIIADYGSHKREGIGLICKETSARWIRPNSIVFCIIAEYDTFNCEYKPAINPC